MTDWLDKPLVCALASLVQQPFGPWLLALLGVGLAAYGAFMLIEARYRRIDIG
jgi:hypothetical protein